MNSFFRTIGPEMILAGLAFAGSHLLGNKGPGRWVRVLGGLVVLGVGILFMFAA